MSVEIIKCRKDTLPHGEATIGEQDEVLLFVTHRKRIFLHLANTPDQLVVSTTDDETLLVLPAHLDDIGAIADLVNDRRRARMAGSEAQ